MRFISGYRSLLTFELGRTGLPIARYSATVGSEWRIWSFVSFEFIERGVRGCWLFSVSPLLCPVAIPAGKPLTTQV